MTAVLPALGVFYCLLSWHVLSDGKPQTTEHSITVTSCMCVKLFKVVKSCKFFSLVDFVAGERRKTRTQSGEDLLCGCASSEEVILMLLLLQLLLSVFWAWKWVTNGYENFVGVGIFVVIRLSKY